MSVRFRCPECQRRLAADDRYAGARIKCPGCGQAVVVPTAEVVAEAAGREPSLSAPPSAPPVPPSGPAEARRRAEARLEPVRAEELGGVGSGEADIDMNPMIDCVFLLLIFFLVTASFRLQKALATPSPEQTDKAPETRTIEEIQSDEDYIIVRIYKDNTITVNGEEAPSAQELRYKLREARTQPAPDGSPGPSNLLVLADGDARHETVVLALDAGNAVGMENVRLATVDEADFW